MADAKALAEALNPNLAGRQPGATYNTPLNPADELGFRQWVSDKAVPFNPDATAPQDYDMRGFYKGLQQENPKAQSAIDPNDNKLHLAADDQPKSFAAKLGETWPARIAQALLSGVTLPGDVYQGKVSMYGDDGHTSPEVINRSADLAGLLSMGSAGAIPESAVGSGMARLHYDPLNDPNNQIRAIRNRGNGIATGKSAAGWEFTRPDAAPGSWERAVAEARSGFKNTADAARSELQQRTNPLMSAEDLAFMNGEYFK